MKRSTLYALLILILISCQAATDTTEKQTDSSNVVVEPKPDSMPIAAPVLSASHWKGILKMSDADFTKKIAATPGLTVVDFSAEWCGPCKKLHPILESLAIEMEGRVNFGNVDVDESPNIATELNISGIPLLVFYKNGKIVDKLVGLLPEADLKAKINEHL